MKHLLLLFCLLPGLAHADAIRFDDSWRDLTFRRYTPTDYNRQGDSLSIQGQSSSSMIYTVLPQDQRDARRASWTWATTASVPATDLAQKGGEDRNLALYFVFTDPRTASGITASTRPARLLGRKARVLVYAWGDDKSPGTRVANPYSGSKGTIYLLRPAGTGRFDETRDLDRDYRAAFGEAPGKLVAVAVAADSDDTDSKVAAQLSGLTLN